MSKYTGHSAQRFIQSKAGFVSVAALLCLSGPVELFAQSASNGRPQPRVAQAPAEPTPGPTTPSETPPKPSETPPAPPTGTPPAAPPTGDAKPQQTLPQVKVQARRPRPTAQRAAPAPRQRVVTPRPAAAPAAPAAPAASDAQAQGPTGSYTPGYGSGTPSLTRVPTPVVNTPQTVNTVTQQVIREQVNTSVRDALRNVAGVTFRAGEGGNQGDTPYLRGFSAQSDVFRDGVRDPGWYTRDTFAVDAIEVYKGPASVLFGRGSTGGVINLVSKTPLQRNFVDTYITANTGPGERAQVDANGKIAEGLWGRVVGMGQFYDIKGRDNIEENRWGISPSLLYKANETKITLSYIYQHDFSVPDYGIPFLSPAWGYPRSVVPVNRANWYGILGGPLPDTERVDAQVTTGKIEHEFNDSVKFTNITRHNMVERLQRNVFPEPNANVPPPPNLNAPFATNRAQVDVTNTQFANQMDLTAKFWTGPLDHTLVVGTDVSRESRDFLRNQFALPPATTITPTNFLTPDPWRFGGFIQPPTATQLTYGEATDFGAFIADQVKITKYFELLGRVRYDQYKFRQTSPLQTTNALLLGRLDNLPSWQAAAVVHPIENTSVYVMRGTSFNPSADNLTISLATVGLPPEQNVTNEVGAKAEVLNKRLILQTAFFDIEKLNMRVPNPSDLTVNILAGKVKSQGWEASAAGNITKEWGLIATYTCVHARITETTIPIQLNAEPLNTPTHAFSLWTTYDLTPWWQVGGGAFYTHDYYSDLQTTGPLANTALVPAYWRYDAMMAFKLSPKVTLQFNAYNLTNEYYIASAYTNWGVPGPSRTFALTARGSL